jgi:hypothetical protein
MGRLRFSVAFDPPTPALGGNRQTLWKVSEPCLAQAEERSTQADAGGIRFTVEPASL